MHVRRRDVGRLKHLETAAEARRRALERAEGQGEPVGLVREPHRVQLAQLALHDPSQPPALPGHRLLDDTPHCFPGPQ